MKPLTARAHHLAVALLISLAPASACAADQSFLVHSDTQYQWSDDGKNRDPMATLTAQSKAIALWLARQPKAAPVFLNGDVTAYGHGDEWEVMLRDLGHRLIPNRYWGLGNHDYDNNIRLPDGSGCFNNGCARDSIYHLDAATKHWDLDAFDYRTRDDGLFRYHDGSLAYSKTIGDITFIQLHNHYAYQDEFKSTVGLRNYVFRITPSLHWLGGVLEKANAAGKFVVINMHRPPLGFGSGPEAEAARAQFKKLVTDHRVLAIFHGHTHVAGIEEPIGDTPVFNSGASFRKTFLTADLDLRANQLTVYQANDNKVSRTPLQTVQLTKVFAPEVVLRPTPLGEPALLFSFGNTRRDLRVGWIKVKLSGESTEREGPPNQQMNGLTPKHDYNYVLTAYDARGGQVLATFTGSFNSGNAQYPPTDLCLGKWDVDQGHLTLHWERPLNFPAVHYSFVEGYSVDSGEWFRFRGPNDTNQGSTEQTIYYTDRGIADPTRLNYAVYYWSSSRGHTPAALLRGEDFFKGAGCLPK